jgi:hypothetical protein
MRDQRRVHLPQYDTEDIVEMADQPLMSPETGHHLAFFTTTRDNNLTETSKDRGVRAAKTID